MICTPRVTVAKPLLMVLPRPAAVDVPNVSSSHSAPAPRAFAAGLVALAPVVSSKATAAATAVCPARTASLTGCTPLRTCVGQATLGLLAVCLGSRRLLGRTCPLAESRLT